MRVRDGAEATAAGRAGTVLGLRANWRQFWLLVLVNAFVGAMVGLERAVLPLIAEREFRLASAAAVLSFIATFGVTKALTNLIAGHLADRVGRKRVLILGWLFGLPVPVLIMLAPSWAWIVAANVLLGVNQGLAWSTTVVMKIDLVGPRHRGLAMGLNEFAGYVAVGAAALASGMIASRWGLRPEPFYLGIGFAAVGLGVSLLFVRDTGRHVRVEQRLRNADSRSETQPVRAAGREVDPRPSGPATQPTGLPPRAVFARTSWSDPSLSSCSQAGLVNNLNDGLAWGLFPLVFASAGLSVEQIGVLAAIYPLTWGLCQLGTGALSDRLGRKWLIVTGMVVQGAALLAIAGTTGFGPWLVGCLFLGLGTALVYPTLLAAVADGSAPGWRATAIGVYRLWRDSGYVIGALAVGALTDALGSSTAIAGVGAFTIGSGLLVAGRMPGRPRRP